MIVKRTSVACRCNRAACQHRRRLPKHPSEYQRAHALRCHQCGKGRYRPDPHRNSGKEYRRACTCCGYSFPHRKGSLWCEHNPALTAEMLQARHESGRWA